MALSILLAGSVGSMAASEAAAVPEVHTKNDIAYVSGGVGQDEREHMRAMAGRFNVRLDIVSAKNGEALSDVDVAVVDAHGKLRLRVHTEGPLLYLMLPRGRYQITSAYRGAMQTVNIRAGIRPVDMVVRLPVDPGAGEWLLCKRGCAAARTGRSAG